MSGSIGERGIASAFRRVANRVDETEPVEGGPADPAGIAPPAGQSIGSGVVTTVRQAVVDAQRAPALDDLLLGEGQERCVDPEPALPLDAGARGQVGERLKRTKIFRPAVRVARVVDAIDADIDIESR